MLTLHADKYQYEGLECGLHRFRRKGKNEWLFVEKARLLDLNSHSIRYFDSHLSECTINSNSLELRMD